MEVLEVLSGMLSCAPEPCAAFFSSYSYRF